MKPFALTASTLVAAFVLGIGTTSAFAHEGEDHNTLKAAHGGQLGVAGALSYELVVAKNAKEGQDSTVLVYVTDHAGKPFATSGATGSATLLAGKSKSTVALQPDGDNRMKGVGRYTSTPDLKVVISITLTGKQPEQTRFAPLALKKDGH
ncbi:MAG TPA: hypothetical protein PLL01_00690 [Rhodoferax sp.]|nr:hypothetical protein [Rhodoferax sp.]